MVHCAYLEYLPLPEQTCGALAQCTAASSFSLLHCRGRTASCLSDSLCFLQATTSLLCGINLITDFLRSLSLSWLAWLPAQCLSPLIWCLAPSAIVCGLTFKLISCHSSPLHSLSIYLKFQPTPNPPHVHTPDAFQTVHWSLLPPIVLCSSLCDYSSDYPVTTETLRYIPQGAPDLLPMRSLSQQVHTHPGLLI